jgi:hypothetical protein
MLTRLAAVNTAVTAALALLLIGWTGSASAQAPGPECGYVDDKGVCVVRIKPPAAPDIEPIGSTGAGGNGEPVCAEYGEPVACSSSTFGTYSNELQCYLQVLSPQPPPDSPLWQGHYPEGAVYNCLAAFSYPGTIAGGAVWLPGPPEAGLSPEAAARAVVARMDLRPAQIGIVPEDKPGSIGAVGAPVYMWTTPEPATFGPQVLTGSAGGVTITATAKVDRIVWNMGDGATVTCRTPGTPYEDRFGFAESPDCGHRYTKTSAREPSNAYPITATSYWVVDWTGPGGSSGQITLDLVSRTNIVIGELQAVITG